MSEPIKRALEREMTAIPNFPDRGYGVVILQRIIPENVLSDLLDLLDTTFAEIRNTTFRFRLQENITESRDYMVFRGTAHKETFEKFIANHADYKSAFLSAVYLLTADKRLWSKAKRAICGGRIEFEYVQLGEVSSDAYALYMTAKDLYCGTRHITLSDLADKDLVSTKLFQIICNAMTIRRYGNQALMILMKTEMLQKEKEVIHHE